MKTKLISLLFLITYSNVIFGLEYFCSVKFTEDKKHKYVLQVSRIISEETNQKGELVYIIEGKVDSEKYKNVSLHYSIRASSCDQKREVIEAFNKKGNSIFSEISSDDKNKEKEKKEEKLVESKKEDEMNNKTKSGVPQEDLNGMLQGLQSNKSAKDSN